MVGRPVSDLGDDETVPTRPHRCGSPSALKRKRRGRPRAGEQAECSCGREYVWTEGAFAQWLPTTSETVRAPGSRARTSPVRRQ